MAGLFDRVAGKAINLMAREAVVRDVDDHNDRFRQFTLEVAGETPSWAPGNKVQFVLGARTMRTLTPFAWNGNRASFLVYRAGHGPLAPWADALAPGTDVRFLGPRRSVVLDTTVPPVLVGDETSVAIAAAWQEFGTGPAPVNIFEASGSAPLTEVLETHDIAPHVIVEREPDDRHHGALAAAVAGAAREHPGSRLVLTGRSQTIRALRRELKAGAVTSEVRGRAYWDTNRAGLD